MVLRKADIEYSPLDRGDAIKSVRSANDNGELLTGLLFIDETQQDLRVEKPENKSECLSN